MSLNPARAYYWKVTWSNEFRLVVQDGIGGATLYDYGLPSQGSACTLRTRTTRTWAPTTAPTAKKPAGGPERPIGTSGSETGRGRHRWVARSDPISCHDRRFAESDRTRACPVAVTSVPFIGDGLRLVRRQRVEPIRDDVAPPPVAIHGDCAEAG